MSKIEGQIRIPSGCAIAAVLSREGRLMTGETIIESMKPMHDRSNGLGGGFAAYGIYPEYRDFFALHLFLEDRAARKNCEAFLRETMEIVREERIPTRKTPAITDEPLIWRFFVTPLRSVLASMQIDEEECVARTVMAINTQMKGVYVFSSGKNMGVFKAVGFPEDVGHFYRLEDYAAYSWRRMAGTPPIRRAGGAARTRSPCWIVPSSTTGKYPPTTPIAASWKCSATAAPCRRIPRSSPISRIIFSAGRSFRWRSCPP